MKPWQTIKSQIIIKDLPWLKVSVEHVLLPNGKEIDNFYQIHLPEYAVIVAQTQEGLIVMERQYKHAIGKIILNLPAGYLNLNESPLACAQRELLEETGRHRNARFKPDCELCPCRVGRQRLDLRQGPFRIFA